jgi:hypothetical protein
VTAKDLQSYSACREVVDGVDEVAQVVSKTIQLSDHESVMQAVNSGRCFKAD